MSHYTTIRDASAGLKGVANADFMEDGATIYAAGRATNAANNTIGVILKSTDGGLNWSLDYTFEPYASNTADFAYVLISLDKDPVTGTYFASARGLDSGGILSWHMLSK